MILHLRLVFPSIASTELVCTFLPVNAAELHYLSYETTEKA